MFIHSIGSLNVLNALGTNIFGAFLVGKRKESRLGAARDQFVV